MDERRKARPTHRRDTRRLRRQRREAAAWWRDDPGLAAEDNEAKEWADRKAKGEAGAQDPPF
jgi:hypothetical protein